MVITKNNKFIKYFTILFVLTNYSSPHAKDRYTELMCEWAPKMISYNKERQKCSTHVCLFGFHARESQKSLEYFEEYSDVVDGNKKFELLINNYRETLSISSDTIFKLTGDYIGVAKGIKDDDLLGFWSSYISSLGYKREVEKVFELRDSRYQLLIEIFSERNISYSEC